MPTGVIVVLLVLLGALVLVHRRIIRRARSRAGRVAGTVAMVAGAVLTAATAVGLAAGSGAVPPGPVRWISAAGLTWLAVVFYLLVTALVLVVVWIPARIVVRLRPAADLAARRLVRGVATVGVTASILVTGYGLFEAASPRVSRTTIPLAAMPAAFGPLRIALVTDVHAGPVRGRGFVEKVVRTVNAERPDLVVLGGDLIDGTVERIGDDLEPLRGLRAPLGVLAVTGNHEYYADSAENWLRRWRQVGVRTLTNESARLRRGGATVTVVGVNDHRGTAPLDPDYTAALAGVEPDAMTVAVAHEPLQASEFATRAVDLQLSGHTHGGQLWPFGYLVRLQQPTLAGLDVVDSMPVYTSRGAGAWGPPVRVAAPPEIALIELTPA